MFLEGALAQSCGKISEVDSGVFTATKICTPGCYTGKILSSVENSRNVSKINWNLFLALQPEIFKIIYNLPNWTRKINDMAVIWALDAICPICLCSNLCTYFSKHLSERKKSFITFLALILYLKL